MSEIESVVSLAIKLNGLNFEKLAVDIANELQDEVEKLLLSSWDHVTEKLQVLSMFMRESLQKTACDVSIPVLFCNIVDNLWEPMFEKLANSDSDQHAVEFLALVILLCHEHKTLLKKLNPLINSILEDHQNKASSTTPQNALLVIEAVLQFPFDSPGVLKVQEEVFKCLVNVIGSFSDVDIKNNICLRVVGVFLKSAMLLPYDQELFDTMWRETEMKFLSSIDRVREANELDYCRLLHHCLLLYDILLEIAVCKKDDSLWQDFIMAKAAALLSNPGPWMITQQGLQCNEAPVRKEALFNLRQALFIVDDYSLNIKCYHKSKEFDKTALFYWCDDSKEVTMSFWHTFLLLIETLEENQLHVVSPVLKKFDSLVATTHTNQFSIHTSWICVLLHRMMQHESK